MVRMHTSESSAIITAAYVQSSFHCNLVLMYIIEYFCDGVIRLGSSSPRSVYRERSVPAREQCSNSYIPTDIPFGHDGISDFSIPISDESSERAASECHDLGRNIVRMWWYQQV